jgi:hypothetical protein
MRGMLDPVLDDAHLILEQPVIQKANALHLLLRLVRGLSLALTTQETMAMSRIIMREQIEPTAAFDVIYDTGIGPIHRALTGLLAAAVGADARAPEMIMHSHALLGTVLSFRVAHETILRRMQWKCIGPEQSQQIAEVAAQHSLALVLTLRSTLRESKRPSRLEVQSNSKPSHSPPRSASPRATQPRLRKKKAIP